MIDTGVRLFVKREFIDKIPDENAPAKPRIIQGCSDEVLAYLGPYCHGLAKKLDKMQGIAKRFAAHQICSWYARIVDKAAKWNKRVVAYDMNNFDHCQLEAAMEIQRALYLKLGLPVLVADFMLDYDIEWRAVHYGQVGRKRTPCISYRSSMGGRKTGDPHTSVGNNLFHWFVVTSFMAYRGLKPSDIEFMINGDDFVGTFRTVNRAEYAKHVNSLGLTLEWCDKEEFCGGHYLGIKHTYVRDPHRALFKFGWAVSIPGETSSLLSQAHANSICQSYVASGNPILSALVARTYQLSRHSNVAEIDPRRVSYRLLAAGLDLTKLNPEFTTSVDFSVRLDYEELFGIPISTQIAVEKSIMSMGLLDSLPAILGILLE
jgi:hypothetical protein